MRTELKFNTIHNQLPFSGELKTSTDIYVKTAHLLDKICKFYLTVCLTGSLEAFVMPYVKPFYHHLQGKYTLASWFTPYKTMYAAQYYSKQKVQINPSHRGSLEIRRVPYDASESSIGFAFVLIGQQVGLLTTAVVSAMTLNTHVSLNFYIVTILGDLSTSITKINEYVVNRAASQANKMKISKYVVEMLRFHYWIIQ